MTNFQFFICSPSSISATQANLLKVKLGCTSINILGIILLFALFSGCNYYKVFTTTNPKTENLQDRLYYKSVIHYGSEVFVIDNLSIKNDSVYGIYVINYKFPEGIKKFPKINSKNRKKSSSDMICDETHYYLRNVQRTVQSNITKINFAVKDIYRFDYYGGCTHRRSYLFDDFPSGCIDFFCCWWSCPFIYVNNGEKFQFIGEIYSGAVYSPLERNDYLILPKPASIDGNYQIKIANELKEIQYSNLAELLVIDHPAKSAVLIDKYGNYQTAIDLKSPVMATNLLGTDILSMIKEKDSVSYRGISPNNEIPLTDGAILTFDLPKNVSSAKIFIRSKNSVWLDYVYKTLHELLGSYSDNWTNKQNKSDPEKLKAWSLNQKIPLSIYVEKNGQWVFCDYFNMAGPAALKEDVLAIDLKGIGNGQIKIKLESGCYFWEIDYVGVDFSENLPLDIKTVKIENAITEKNVDVTELLKNGDSKYYIQPDTTNIATIKFIAPAKTNSERTVILHSKGYYQTINEAKGFPKIKKLKTIQKPGKFLEYSRNLMKTEIEKFKGQKLVNRN